MEDKVLIDSSCWIHFFRGTDSRIVDVTKSLISADRALVCGPTYTEVVGGCRTAKETAMTLELFDSLSFLDLKRDDYRAAAILQQKLKKKGFFMGGLDLMFAYLAGRNRCSLFHQDKIYDHVASHVAFNVFKD